MTCYHGATTMTETGPRWDAAPGQPDPWWQSGSLEEGSLESPICFHGRRRIREVVIRLDCQTRTAFVCSTWPDQSRKRARLFGESPRVSTRDGKITSVFWTVPLEAIRFRAKKRTLTPAQAEALCGALRKARSPEKPSEL